MQDRLKAAISAIRAALTQVEEIAVQERVAGREEVRGELRRLLDGPSSTPTASPGVPAQRTPSRAVGDGIPSHPPVGAHTDGQINEIIDDIEENHVDVIATKKLQTLLRERGVMLSTARFWKIMHNRRKAGKEDNRQSRTPNHKGRHWTQNPANKHKLRKLSKANKRRWAGLTPEQRNDRSEKQRQHYASLSPQQRAARTMKVRRGIKRKLEAKAAEALLVVKPQ